MEESVIPSCKTGVHMTDLGCHMQKWLNFTNPTKVDSCHFTKSHLRACLCSHWLPDRKCDKAGSGALISDRNYSASKTQPLWLYDKAIQALAYPCPIDSWSLIGQAWRKSFAAHRAGLAVPVNYWTTQRYHEQCTLNIKLHLWMPLIYFDFCPFAL